MRAKGKARTYVSFSLLPHMKKGLSAMKTRKYPKSRKMINLLGDVGIIIFTYLIMAYLMLPSSAWHAHRELYSGMLPLTIVLTILIFIINDLYTIAKRRFSEVIISLAVSLFMVLVLIMALSFFIHGFAYSRVLVLVSTLVEFVLLSVWKRIMQKWEQNLHGTQRVMLIGSEEECQHVYWRMSAQPQIKWKLRRVVINSKLDWRKEADRYRIDIIVICSDVPLATRSAIVNYCADKEIQPYIIPSAYEIFCNEATLQRIDDVPVFMPKSLRLSVEHRFIKRTMDIILSGIAAICALPFGIPAAIAIKLEDHGPIFYSQVRVGRFGKEYKVYKFRSMRVDAEKYSGPQLAAEDDPRITKVGKFIRATRLDELPQILNVLNGDMSLVGPRPERPYFVKKFIKQTPEYAYRHNVKPGITGLAQVFAKYNTTPYDKLVYDLMYIENFSIAQDLVIMVQTVKILFTKSATEGVSDQDVDISKYE